MTEAPAFLTRHAYPPYKIAALVEALADNGVTAQKALGGTGLNAADLYNSTMRTSVQQFLRVCENALALTSDATLPFRTGMKLHLSSYGMYGYALLCSVTMRDFLNSAIKYHSLATPTLTMRWREEGSQAIWYYSDRVDGLRSELRKFLFALQFTQTMTHMKDVLGSACKPLLATMNFDRPAQANVFENYLGCSVEFSAAGNELRYHARYLTRAPKLAHRITSSLLIDMCDRLADEINASSHIAKKVTQALLKTPGKFPGIELVAADLNMTSRTLRRRLLAEDTSYNDIMTDLRKSLALRYLITTRMSVEAVANAVGFNDTANFRRALKRWTGKAPADFRRLSH